MAIAKILIVIQGGVVQSICTTNEDVQVCIVDYDELDTEDPSTIDDAVNVEQAGWFANWADTITGEDLTPAEQMVKTRLQELDEEFPLDKEPFTAFGFDIHDVIRVNEEDGVDDVTEEEAEDILKYMLRKADSSLGVGDAEILAFTTIYRENNK